MISQKLFNDCLFENLDCPFSPCPATAKVAMRIMWLRDTIDAIHAECYPVA